MTTPDLSSLSSPLIDTERNLGLLLGLHASYLAMSTCLSPMEIECASEFSVAQTHSQRATIAKHSVIVRVGMGISLKCIQSIRLVQSALGLLDEGWL